MILWSELVPKIIDWLDSFGIYAGVVCLVITVTCLEIWYDEPQAVCPVRETAEEEPKEQAGNVPDKEVQALH